MGGAVTLIGCQHCGRDHDERVRQADEAQVSGLEDAECVAAPIEHRYGAARSWILSSGPVQAVSVVSVDCSCGHEHAHAMIDVRDRRLQTALELGRILERMGATLGE